VDEEEADGREEQQEPFEQRSGLTVLSAACSQHICEAVLPAVANIFAVVCATNAEGERVYPWGAVSIHDERCSDFRRLQRLVVESDQVTQMIDLTQRVSIRLASQDSAAYEIRPAAAGSLVAWHLPSLKALFAGWWGFKDVAPRAAAVDIAGGVRKLLACGGEQGVMGQKERAALRVTTHVAILVGLAMVISSAVYHLKALLLVR